MFKSKCDWTGVYPISYSFLQFVYIYIYAVNILLWNISVEQHVFHKKVEFIRIHLSRNLLYTLSILNVYSLQDLFAFVLFTVPLGYFPHIIYEDVTNTGIEQILSYTQNVWLLISKISFGVPHKLCQ